MYRGLLKRTARVWSPREIQDAGIQQQVLARMQAAERVPPIGCGARTCGVGSADTNTPLSEVASIDVVDNLQTLREIVIALETAAEGKA